jgi:hypothetical protein
MRPIGVGLLVAAAVLGSTSTALAAPLTVTATGHLTRVDTHVFPDGGMAPDRLGALGVQVGSPFTLTLVYEPTTAAQFTLSPNPGETDSYYPAEQSFLLTVHTPSGDVQFGEPNAPAVGAQMIKVIKNTTHGQDQFWAGTSGMSSATTPLAPSFPGDPKLHYGTYFTLEDSTHTALADASLPTSFLLSAWDSNPPNTNSRFVGFSLYYDAGGGWNDGNATDYGLYGTIESITPAPPASPVPAMPCAFVVVMGVLLALVGVSPVKSPS